MLNAGKESYDNISIPDDKLLSAIRTGMLRGKKQRQKRFFQTFAASAASAILILFGCANIPMLYTYAEEIPIIRAFVQALQIGQGGKEQPNVTASVASDSKSVTISFFTDEGITNAALSYSVSYHYAPVRLQVVFHGIGGGFYEMLEEKLENIAAVADMYQIKALDENDTAFVIVLNELYNYELMEFSNPGSVTIRFYQDAYYTSDQKRPGQEVYFLRTNAILSDSELTSLLMKYQKEEVSQLQNASGENILVIGGYDSLPEAKQAYREITEKYGADSVFYVSGCKIEDIPR